MSQQLNLNKQETKFFQKKNNYKYLYAAFLEKIFKELASHSQSYPEFLQHRVAPLCEQ